MIGQIIVFFKKVQPLSNKPYQNNIFTREEYFKDCDVEIHNLFIKLLVLAVVRVFSSTIGHTKSQFDVLQIFKGHCPKCSANPITVIPIWKWEFENKEHPIRGLFIYDSF